MKPRNRKFVLEKKLLNDNEPHNPHEPNLTITEITPRIPLQNDQNQNSTSKKHQQEEANPNVPFDSSMALTVLALLIALFFMGLFSVYIRRISAADSTLHDISRRHRRRQLGNAAAINNSLYVAQSSDRPRGTVGLNSGNNKGVDISTVRSLPVYYYHRGDEKQGIRHENDDCAVCLCEFEESEEVKTIPFCKHVFHVCCIEKWLSAHVSCPLCRTTRFFPDDNVKVVGDDDDRIEVEESTMERRDTWSSGNIMSSSSSVRRINSCSSLGERATLQRTSSC